MSGICGWLTTEQSVEDSRSVITRMMDGLPSLSRAELTDYGDSHGIGARATGHDFTLVDETGTIVSLDGHLEFRDPELHARARDRGPASAVLHGYRLYGKDVLDRIGGEYAIGVLEPGRQRLFLAIDRLGGRPMAFATLGDSGIVFGSTTEAVRRHPAIDATIDPQALFDYVYFHEIPSSCTVYQGVRKLRPAEFLLLEDGKLTIDSHWSPQFADASTIPDAELEHALREALANAVKRRLPDDRPTACFLSGGLDSSTVVGMAAREQTGKTIAYTMGFDAEGYDEMYYSRLAAKQFNAELREYYVTQQDIIDAMPIIAREYDEPFGNSSAVPTLMCARRARADGIEYMLAGDGGDELFGGNERYAKQGLFESYHRIPKALRSGLIEPLTGVFPGLFPLGKIRSYVEQARIPMPGRLETYNLLNREPHDKIFESVFLERIDASHPLDLQRARYEAARSESLVNRMIWLDWKFTLADNDLRKVTRSCEIAGVEAAYPMMDRDLVELSLRMGPKQKVKGNNLRSLYKSSLQGFLPREIIDKPKHGFGLPFGVWLATSSTIQDLIYPAIDALSQRGIFRPAFLSNLLEANRTGHAAFYGNQIYVLSMLELWLSAHEGKS